jgi:hypothetical protein
LRIGQPLFQCHRGGATFDISRSAATQDQVAAEQRRQRRAHRIESLHQVQARRSRFRRADHGDVRIGCDLQQRDARRDDEKGGEHHAVRRQPGGGDHQQGAGRHDQQPDHHRTLVADAFDQLRRRDGRDEIRDEPYRFNQRRLRVVEIEHRAQMRQQGVVDDGDEPPHEKQAGQQGQRRSLRVRDAGSSICSHG